MTDLDQVLRRAAQNVHADVGGAIDIEADLATTLERAEGVAPVVELGGGMRRGTAVLRVAAVGLLAVGAVGAVLWMGRGGGDDAIVTSPATTTAPEETVAASTAAPPPSTIQPVPATTAPLAPVVPVASCLVGMDGAEAAENFVDAMLAARASGDLGPLAGCLDAVPEVYTGVAPACWAECEGATRTIMRESFRTGRGELADRTPFVSSSLPVSYRDEAGFVDVTESWRLVPTDGGFRLIDFTIEETFLDREASLAVITDYLGHIESEDWLSAAAMLDDGAVNPEDRSDLQRLDPDAFDDAGVAAALADWCRDGCDTTPPTADELTFTGIYGVTRGSDRIEAAWFEGIYSIAGLPFRTATSAPPGADVDLLATWPPPPDITAVELPQLLPAAPVPAAATAVREEWDAEPVVARWYDQRWYATDGGAAMTIRTDVLGQPTTPEFARIETEIAPWDEAFFSVADDGFNLLELADPSGTVQLWSWNLGNDALDRVARSLAGRNGGPGWDVGDPPPSLVALDEGWDAAATTRNLYWLDAGGSTVAQLTVVGGHTDLAASSWSPEAVVELTTVADAPAVVTSDERRASVVWTIDPHIDVRFTLVGSADDALAIARSISAVDESTWGAASTLDNNANEGCRLNLHC